MITAAQEQARTRLLALAMTVALGLLCAALWRMQVGRGSEYESSAAEQSVRGVRIPAMRGRIFDRNGVCLADNGCSYTIEIYLEELRRGANRRRRTSEQIEELVSVIANVAGLSNHLTRTQIEAHVARRKPLPLVAWRGVDETALARLAEWPEPMPAVEIAAEAVRVYPKGRLAAHLLGYVARSQPSDEEEGTDRYHYYLPDMRGKRGLEAKFDGLLSGRAGGRLVRVDVAGFQHTELRRLDPQPGGDLMLALDWRIQALAERALEGAAGAVVVVDPSCGDLLALASAPAFDPNRFYPGMSAREWAALRDDPLKPMLNRACSGVYPPGSVFKPIVAIAALDSGRLMPDTVFKCPGFFSVGERSFGCYMNRAHGLIDVRGAIQVSCNVFFYQAGLLAGPDQIARVADEAGLGRPTLLGIEEAAGLVPTPEWKSAQGGQGWRDGDTCNLAIGQGALLVTPLQMAMAAAAIANGGTLYRPRLVLGQRLDRLSDFSMSEKIVVRRAGWSSAALRVVREAMRDVVETPTGTGRLAALPDVVMAGKTGTAEYGRKGEGRKHGWMILFAPYDRPRYAVAMVLDDAVSGGVSVGPRLHDLMAGIFALESEQGGT